MTDRDIETYLELGQRRMQCYLLRETISVALGHDNGPAMRRVLRNAYQELATDLNTVEDAMGPFTRLSPTEDTRAPRR